MTKAMMTYFLPLGVQLALAIFVLKYPKEWLITKAKFIICNMQTLPEVTYWYNGGEGTDYDLTAYGMMPTNRRTLFHRIVTQYIIWAAWLRTPWFMFLIAALLAAARRFLAGGPCADAKLIFFAFCHEFAFFVTSQSFEYRYFFPSSILLALACLLSLLELLPALWRRLRRHSRPNSNQRSAA